MKVSELINKLKKMDGNKKIIIYMDFNNNLEKNIQITNIQDSDSKHIFIELDEVIE